MTTHDWWFPGTMAQTPPMHAEPTVVVAAQLLTDGSAVYLRANETWTRQLEEAAVFSWTEGEQQVAVRAWDGEALVFGVGVVEAERRDDVTELFGRSCGR
jgi:hypothetical protein